MHAGPGGAYIMMRPLRQRSWYKHLDLRWQTDILHLLPPSTVLEIKRTAVAILLLEAHRTFTGPHPLIRSYNMHASSVRRPPSALPRMHACSHPPCQEICGRHCGGGGS